MTRFPRIIPLFLVAWLLATGMGAVYIMMFPLRDFDPGSDILVENSLRLPEGHPRKGHLLLGNAYERLGKPLKQVPWVASQIENGEQLPYMKQFGLQAMALDRVQRVVGWKGARAVLGSRLVECLLHGFVFAAFVAGLGARRGSGVALAFLALALCWPGFWRWVPSLYWQAGLTLAVFTWFLLAPTRPGWLAPTVGFVFFLLRFLCGYEYLTSVSLGAVVCLAANRVLRGEKLAWAPLAGTWACSVIAFVAAIALHVWRTTTLGASLEEAWVVFMAPVKYRTVGAGDLGTPVLGMLSNMISVFFQHGTLLLIVLGAVLVPAWVSGAGDDGSEQRLRKRVPLLLVAALLASLSWQVLAPGHSGQHAHLNHVVFLQPFAFLLFWFFAEITVSAIRSGAAADWARFFRKPTDLS